MLSLLKERGLTLGAAESCTGGLIAKRMTDPARRFGGVQGRGGMLFQSGQIRRTGSFGRPSGGIWARFPPGCRSHGFGAPRPFGL